MPLTYYPAVFVVQVECMSVIDFLGSCNRSAILGVVFPLRVMKICVSVLDMCQKVVFDAHNYFVKDIHFIELLHVVFVATRVTSKGLP